ncbi:MAG: hypothetical protein QNK37_03080 [Acidobacteriota bacterium]|nr:hypothetical protein [Acidobacteriota bacterium]
MYKVSLIIMLAFCLGVHAPAEETVSRNTDRNTDKLVFNPKTPKLVAKSGRQAAEAYLKDQWQRFGLEKEARNLKLERVTHSLLGTHYFYRQQLQGLPVEGASVVVSVAKDGSISKVFNSTWPVYSPVAARSSIHLSKEDAMDVSWQHLRVHGELMIEPTGTKAWMVEDGVFRLIWRVRMHTTAPVGDWSLAIDAVDGKVISLQEMSRSRHDKSASVLKQYDGELNNLDVEMERVRKRDREREQRARRAKTAKKADGRGLVFDPDPRTTLNREDIFDASDPEVFTDAYFWRDLKDLTVEDGTYSLTGPWVTVASFNAPATPPSTTTDGIWEFNRGNNAFNDAMTYFQLDQSQRYIQSLGFVGDRAQGGTGIQYRSIEVDTDAENGDDNSFFYSGLNAITYGHGCVDDSEDADVILHEYGHALQYSINPEWFSSGDEGAMGEGFSDYWAGSYSYSTPNGPIFNPEWIYTWDGHVECWPGRVMDQFLAVYDPNRTYFAHQFVSVNVNGQFVQFESDELWATPLFQTLVELTDQGIPRSEVDRMILEGHNGLGSPLRMPEAAASMVNAAAALHPDGPHAQVLRNAFARHNILDRVDSYDYHSIHISPGTSGWQNEVVIHNPSDTAANVTAKVYQGDSSSIGLTDYSELSSEVIVLNPGDTHTFVPGGDRQRWISFESDQPLAGTTVVERSGEGLGSERATIPLLAETEVSSTLVFPHVPADRAVFWSGGVILNPGDTMVNLTYELIGTDGNDLTNLLSGDAPATLAPRQKYVALLAGGLFDDSGSAEKVSWVRITGDGELGGFQLYGYNATDSQIATSGIISQPDQSRGYWPIRASLTNSDFNGFSILNPTDADVTASMYVVYKDRSLSDAQTVTIPARGKKLGLNTASSFQFPSNEEDKLFNLADSTNIQAVVLDSEAPLRVFELVGDTDGSTLDGAAVTGPTSHTVFPNPSGTLELMRLGFPGDVTVHFVDSGQMDVYTMQPNASLQIAIPDGTTAIEVTGDLVLATVIHKDEANRFLATINGKQIAFNP